MKQGTFVTIFGLALAGSAIAATASTQAISAPAGQATPVATPSSLASMMPNPGPSVVPSASATPKPN
jgi:hypothetical protein